MGCMVIFRRAGSAAHPNIPVETLESPAVVTRVLPDGRVNLHVFFDGQSAAIRVSVSGIAKAAASGADRALAAGWRCIEGA